MPVQGQLGVPGLVKHIEQVIITAADDAADETTALGVRMAKRLAPVRKVSYIEKRARPRGLSRAEIARLPAFASGGARNARGQFTGSQPQRATIARRAQQILEASEVEEFDGGFRLKDESGRSFLTGRGEAELRESGRREATAGVDFATGKIVTKPGTSAIYTQRTSVLTRGGVIKHTSRSTLGGRLRGEIYGEKANVRGGRIVYHIVSPTPYAKFVELPTSRTSEQPYLRPTLKALRGPFKAKVFRNLKRAGLNPHFI